MSHEDRIKRLQQLNVLSKTRIASISERSKIENNREKARIAASQEDREKEVAAIKSMSEAASKLIAAKEKESKLAEKEEEKEKAALTMATPVTRKKKGKKTSVIQDIDWVYRNFFKIVIPDERGLKVMDEVFLANEAPSDGALFMAHIAFEIGHVAFGRDYVSKVLQKEKPAPDAPKDIPAIIPKPSEAAPAKEEDPAEPQEEVVNVDPDIDDILGYMK
jgi:hypothetical protein